MVIAFQHLKINKVQKIYCSEQNVNVNFDHVKAANELENEMSDP